MSVQNPLFNFDSATEPSGCLETETTDTMSRMPDKRSVRRLVGLAGQLEAADQPVKPAQLASEIRDIAEKLVAVSILDANQEGLTWRQIGAELGVPFQTLYRRYGVK